MILVIFGAGASYDSVPAYPPSARQRSSLIYRPPLAEELFYPEGFFANALKEIPECHRIVPYLRSLPNGVTFEQRLGELDAQSEQDPVRKRQLAAVRFYLRMMLWECEKLWRGQSLGVTNYGTLLDQLRRSRTHREPILLVTFNYERLLEEALRAEGTGVDIKSLGDYIGSDEFKVYKLHGSIDWAREIEPANQLTRQEIIARAGELKVTDRFRIIADHSVVAINSMPLFPALALPVQAKRYFECPDGHLASLRDHLSKVTKILIVGWRAGERHFLELLKKELPPRIEIQAVAKNRQEAEQSLANIQRAGINFDAYPMDEGFSEYVVSGEAERFFHP